MLEAYSENVTVDADNAIPFNSVSINKGCAEDLSSSATIELNKRGVYFVSFDSSLATATTVQLFKDGIARPQAQSTGTTPNFKTIVQVGQNNCACACTSPTILQIKNVGSASADFINANVTVAKMPCNGI